MLKADTIDDLENVPTAEWNKFLPIGKDVFMKNLDIVPFKEQLESLYRAYEESNTYIDNKLHLFLEEVDVA